MPKLMAGQFGAEITTLLASGAEVIHSSFWGGDLEGLVLQGAPRGLFQKHKVILSAGEPAINRLGARTVRAVRAGYGAGALAQDHLRGPLPSAAELRLLPHNAGDPGREVGLREGQGYRRCGPHAGPGHCR